MVQIDWEGKLKNYQANPPELKDHIDFQKVPKRKGVFST